MAGPSKAEIWLIGFSGTKGHEQKNERPAIIWRDLDHLGMVVVIPCTTSIGTGKYPFTHFLSPSTRNGLTSDSIALIFQISSLDKVRLIKRVGQLDDEDISAIAVVMKDMLHL